MSTRYDSTSFAFLFSFAPETEFRKSTILKKHSFTIFIVQCVISRQNSNRLAGGMGMLPQDFANIERKQK